MLTLASIQSLIQKPKTLISVIIVGGITVSLIFLIILQYKPIQPPAGEQTQPNTALGVLPYPEFIPKTLQHKVKEVTVNLQEQPTLPLNNIGKVYKLIQNADALLKTQQIASGLGFSGEPTKNQKFLSWSQNGRSVTFDTETSRLNFSANLNQDQKRAISSQEEAKNSAINWLIKLTLLPPENQIKITSLKTEGLNFVSEQDIMVAEAYQVVFFETLDGYPVYGQSPRTGTASTIVDKSGNLIKLSTRIVDVDQSQIGTYPLKNITQASTEAQHQGVVVETEVAGVDPLIGEVLNIESINLTILKYAYFKNITEKYIVPIYVFEGNLLLTDGRGGKAVVYLPAIENKYLQPNQP
ncbi:hypothetical protein A2W45_01505 [Candidatus Curtissbacteria bacterium RIFCSPHIGHO2_12_41_11]|uniref:Uncharacterized protein n=2 Tax=Candidatus Curtissiibacteriota TaxID=1752717 RepID=A0A1F5HTH1_9BACT|nr:MAG: hypothetical protein A2W45_01505 [Candidatus Curtissbacteria bacterium RIFCSPHIGHO2_12_41_11]OGE07448.1 MAG: hypothetical protein A2W70_03585 [Candidatus Curtissbacteria bacterium RIFCSPLOWO2_02_41_11]